MDKKPRNNMAFNLIIVVLLVVFCVSVYTFILSREYSNATVNAAVAWDTQCSDAVHRLVSDNFTRDDFTDITSVEDMELERYKELQNQLNELRSLNSTRYLYTAKRGDDGRLIYLIDGLDLGAEDFAYPGTYIEEEMIPYIEAALSGEVIYSHEIIDTTWGHIFTACYPVRANDGTDEIIGALCIEMDMESTYAYIAASNSRTVDTAVSAIVVLILLGVVISVYFRKQKDKELRQQKVLENAVYAADAANHAKSTFLFNMSHDIRTPMNAILGFADLARKNLETPDKADDCLKKIQISGNKMLAIIDNVLEMSQIESGKKIIEESPVEAGSIFDACLTMVQPEADKKHQRITVVKEITHPYAFMDTTCITEIILNLISNSIKYTADGGKIECAIRQIDDREEGWFTHEISVSDNGIGMSEEFQAHIYESFSRERSSTTSGVEGTGLGMGIVKKLIDMMDGTIDLKSRLGEGTTFIVRFPCRIASYEDTQPQKAAVELDKSELKGKRILMAEDNDLNSEIAIALLSEVGLIVDRAENGVECVEMLDKAPEGYYDLILMDVQMPILDGYEAAVKIRRFDNSRKADIPIIAMTANAFAEDRQKALEKGMNEHVAKPIDMNKLIPVLLKYIH